MTQAENNIDEPLEIGENNLNAMYLNTAVQGLLSFIAGYLIVYSVYYIVTGTVGILYDMEINWLYYQMKITPLAEWLWSIKRVIVVFSVGPIAALAFALLSRLLYFTVFRHKDNIVRSILFWTFFHGLNFFFGAAIVGILMNLSDLLDNNRGFGLTFFFLYMGDVWQIFFGALSLLIMVVIGLLNYKFVIKTAFSRRLFKGGSKYRLRFIFASTTLPWLLGSLILMALMYPNYNVYSTMYFPVMGLMIIPILSLSGIRVASTSVKTDKVSQVRPRTSLIIFTLALLVFYRVVLGFGIKVNELDRSEVDTIKTYKPLN